MMMTTTMAVQVAADTPWGLAGTAAGVAVLMVVLFLKSIAQMRSEQVEEMKQQRLQCGKEMQAQRQLFTQSLHSIAEQNAKSAERVESALRDLATEIRSGSSK